MKKFALAIAAVAALMPAMFGVAVSAESNGQLAGGADIYVVRNVTKDTAYATSTAVTCDETIKYSMMLSNTEFGMVTDINLKASLPDGTMNVTAKNSSNDQVATTGKVNVTVEKGTLNYINGSTKLLAEDGAEIKALPDGITTGGVNAGNLNGSTIEFVQFQAKVTCDETPVTPVAPETPETPKALPQTGVASNILSILGLGTIVASIAYYITSRRAARN